MVQQQERKKLKIDKHLPQILLPPKARKMFMEWWNSDIRFEQTIPHSFESGYVILNYDYEDRVEELLIEHKDDVREIAKYYHITYREAETLFRNMTHCFSNLTLHFKFIQENAMYIEMYDATKQLIASMEFAVGKSEPEPELTSDDILFQYGIKQIKPQVEKIDLMKDATKDYFLDSVHSILYLIVTAMWYIATTSKSTKYIYEQKSPVITGRKRNVVKVSDTKTINTPIYDMNKIRVVSIDRLQTRKKGWTYSHSFQVHGHYRHYRNGKTIFIQPYIKGKDKEFKSQQIILDPSENK